MMRSGSHGARLLNLIEHSPTLQLLERRQDGALDVHSGSRLVSRCEQWSAYLDKLDVSRKTPVILPMRSSVDAVTLLLAAWQHDLLPLLVKPTAPIAYLKTVLNRVGRAVVFNDIPSLRLLDVEQRTVDGSPSARFIASVVDPARAGAGAPSLDAGDVGIFTTGSTGEPKIIVHALERIALNASLHARAIGLTRDDTVGLSLSLSFSYGLVAGLLATLLVEARGLLLDPEQAAIQQLLVEHDVTVAMSTPFTARRFAARGTLGRIRTLTIGGDVLHTTLARELLDSNPDTTLYATYGLSEAGPRVATCHVTHPLIDELGAIPLGKPLDGVELRLADIDPDTGIGELHIRTPTRMLGYLGEPESMARASAPGPQELATTDRFVARNGELFFAGRNKRVICRAGEKLYPALIERQILSLGNVRDVVVTAAPHAEYGEIPRAYIIVPDGAFSVPDLERQLRRTLPRSHIPQTWEIVDQFPAGARK